jgi:hypothetical protein
MNALKLIVVTILVFFCSKQRVISASFVPAPPVVSNKVKIQRPAEKMMSGVKKAITRHYIFGYGSLVCSKSRKITAPALTKPAHPVIVRHLRRTWTARVPHGDDRLDNAKDELGHEIHGQTAMGIEIAEDHNCTGVLLEVDPQELAMFDEREKGYDRVEIDLHHIFGVDDDDQNLDEGSRDRKNQHHVLEQAQQRRKSMQDSNAKDGITNTKNYEDAIVGEQEEVLDDLKVWAYIPKDGGAGADHNYPIMQSYVDIILRGCLSISKDFALKFLESTHGWWHDETIHSPESKVPEYVWVDDRHAPYYSRADEEWSSEMKHMLDDLLKDIHPEPFHKRKSLDTNPKAERIEK